MCCGSWGWESHFLGRLIRSLGVPKEKGVWNSQGERKDRVDHSSYQGESWERLIGEEAIERVCRMNLL